MMIVCPDFLDHWKTQLLFQLTGDKASPLLVLRLWAHCQQRRQSVFHNMTPEVLKAICRWEGEPDRLQKALADSGFIDIDGQRVTVHQWAEVNAALLKSWENGKKGGRPPKTQPYPAENPDETDKSGEDQSRDDDTPSPGGVGSGREIPSLEAVKSHAAAIGLPPAEAENFWNYYAARGWRTGTGQPVRSWQAALARWKITGQERAAMRKTTPGGKPITANYDDPTDPLTGQKGNAP